MGVSSMQVIEKLKENGVSSITVIDGNKDYPKENWLQRPNLQLRGFA